MAIRNWLASLFSGKSVVDDAQEGVGWSVFGSGQAAKPDIGWDSLNDGDREALAGKVSLVFDCISYAATSVTEPPMGVMQHQPGGPNIEWVEEHPVHQLLQSPNPFYSRRLFLQFLVWRLLSTGEYFVWKWRNRYEITELWPVPTSWVNVKTGKSNELISGYSIRQDRGERKPIQAQDMVRQWMPDPASTWKAFGPLHGLSRDVQTEERRQNLLGELLKNLNVPGLVISRPNEFTPKQKQGIRAALTGRLGEGGRGRHLILGGGGNVDILNPLKDLDTEGLMASTEPRICAAFGIPPILVGARIGIEHSTYSNYEQARKSFYRETMRPLWQGLADGLTKGLLTDEGAEGTLRIGFDLSRVPELQKDLAGEADRAATLFQRGLATRNEAREIAGLPQVPGRDGQMFLIPSTAFERQQGSDQVEI